MGSRRKGVAPLSVRLLARELQGRLGLSASCPAQRCPHSRTSCHRGEPPKSPEPAACSVGQGQGHLWHEVSSEYDKSRTREEKSSPSEIPPCQRRLGFGPIPAFPAGPSARAHPSPAHAAGLAFSSAHPAEPSSVTVVPVSVSTVLGVLTPPPMTGLYATAAWVSRCSPPVGGGGAFAVPVAICRACGDIQKCSREEEGWIFAQSNDIFQLPVQVGPWAVSPHMLLCEREGNS